MGGEVEHRFAFLGLLVPVACGWLLWALPVGIVFGLGGARVKSS
jgi:hypothetical protein